MLEQRWSSSRVRVVLLVTSIAAIGAVFGGWHYLALHNFRSLVSTFDAKQAPILSLRECVVGPQLKALPLIEFVTVRDYITAFESREAALSKTRADMADGRGMAFWLGKARRDELDRMRSILTTEKEVVAAGRAAVVAVEGIHNRVDRGLADAAKQRTSAVRVLRAAAEIDDFTKCGTALEFQEQTLSGIMRETREAREQGQLTGLAEGIRIGTLVRLDESLKGERESLAIRRVSMAVAANELSRYKECILAQVASNDGAVRLLNAVARDLCPAINVAYERTTPVRTLLDELNEPLFSNQVGGLLNGFTGRQGDVSALSIISSIDPTTSAAVTAISEICSGIATIHTEATGLFQATEPIVRALDAFRQSRTRSSMLDVVNHAPPAASYLESKARIFDPVLDETARARSHIRELEGIASRINVTSARNLVLQYTDRASRLLDVVDQPFRDGLSAILSSATLLRDVSVMETQYLELLKELAGDQPQQFARDMNESGGAATAGASDRGVTRTEDLPESAGQVAGKDEQLGDPEARESGREPSGGHVGVRGGDTGLVAYYPFNGDARDETMYGNHATVNGATLTADRFGNANSAYIFDGVDDYIDVPDGPSLNFGTGEFTICCWVFMDRFPVQDVRIVGKFARDRTGPMHDDNYGYALVVWSKGMARAGVSEGGTGEGVSSLAPLETRRWHFLTAVRANGCLGLYVDGQLQKSVATLRNCNNGVSVEIGACKVDIGDARWFDGQIDDIRIFNRGLPARQIQELFEEGD